MAMLDICCFRLVQDRIFRRLLPCLVPRQRVLARALRLEGHLVQSMDLLGAETPIGKAVH